MDKEKDPILKLRRMEGKLLLLDLKKIIWVAPLSWLMMFISLASLLFSEHQSDWKWNISSVTKSIIPFAKQVWADAADHVRPGCSDPLTCLLTFLTLNAAIVVVIVLEGKSRVKGTIELFSSVSIGTSVFILALTGILTPCLIEEYGLILGLLFILFILVWSCILANASRIYSEEERIKRSEKEQKKELESEKKVLEDKLEKLPGEANKTKYLKWHRYGPPVLLVFIPTFLLSSVLFTVLLGNRSSNSGLLFLSILICALLISLLYTGLLVPMLLEVVVDAEQHSFIRAMGILLWLLMVIFFSPLLPLLTVYPSWSHDTLVLICIALCAVAYAYFLMRLPWTCASRKNWRGRLFNCYRYHSFTNSIKRIDKELEPVNKKLEQRKKSDQKQDQNGTVPPYAPASNMEQPLEQRLAVLERQTAALLDVTEKLEASISSTKQKKTLCGLSHWFGHFLACKIFDLLESKTNHMYLFL